MIERMSGVVLRKGPTFVFLQSGPICFEISVPLSTSHGLPDQGESSLWTHLIWREDGPSLFGFSTQAERELFRLLIRVQGVGPRIALSVLSHLTPAELVVQIRGRSVEGLTRIPGIGPKTAGRILVELGPRVDRIDPAAIGADLTGPTAPTLPNAEDAVQALTALGYPQKEARAAVTRILRDEPALPLDECIRRSLKLLSG